MTSPGSISKRGTALVSREYQSSLAASAFAIAMADKSPWQATEDSEGQKRRRGEGSSKDEHPISNFERREEGPKGERYKV
jgi:hypothetical protein